MIVVEIGYIETIIRVVLILEIPVTPITVLGKAIIRIRIGPIKTMVVYGETTLTEVKLRIMPMAL
jgi:hypothetical protein